MNKGSQLSPGFTWSLYVTERAGVPNVFFTLSVYGREHSEPVVLCSRSVKWSSTLCICAAWKKNSWYVCEEFQLFQKEYFLSFLKHDRLCKYFLSLTGVCHCRVKPWLGMSWVHGSLRNSHSSIALSFCLNMYRDYKYSLQYYMIQSNNPYPLVSC